MHASCIQTVLKVFVRSVAGNDGKWTKDCSSESFEKPYCEWHFLLFDDFGGVNCDCCLHGSDCWSAMDVWNEIMTEEFCSGVCWIERNAWRGDRLTKGLLKMQTPSGLHALHRPTAIVVWGACPSLTCMEFLILKQWNLSGHMNSFWFLLQAVGLVSQFGIRMCQKSQVFKFFVCHAL